MNERELDKRLLDGAAVRDDDLRGPATHAAVLAALEDVLAMTEINPDDSSSRQTSPRRGRPSRRHVTGIAAAACIAVIVAAASLAVGRSDTPPPEQAGTARPDAPVAEASDGESVEIQAQIVSATRAAVSESVVHITQTDAAGYVSQVWSDEATGSFRAALTAADGTTPSFDSGPAIADDPYSHRQVDHCFGEYTEELDQAHRRDGDPVRGPSGLPTGPRSEADVVAGWLESGDIVEDGTELLDGREVLRLAWTVEERTMLVDPDTFRPIEVIGYPGTDDEYVQTYEFLERTPANLAELVPPVPDGYTQVDTLRDDSEGAEAGCL